MKPPAPPERANHGNDFRRSASSGESGGAGASQASFNAKRRTTYESALIIGPSGYGKSSLADEWLQGYAKAGNGHQWICDPLGNWPGHKGAFWQGMPGGLPALDAELRRIRLAGPGIILFDDADFYLRHPTDERMQIIVGNRHWQKDFVAVTRRPQGIHKDLFQIAGTIALFHQRQAYARAYLADELSDDFEGENVVRMIPRERFHYLLLHRESGTSAVMATKKRATITKSDIVSG